MLQQYKRLKIAVTIYVNAILWKSDFDYVTS